VHLNRLLRASAFRLTAAFAAVFIAAMLVLFGVVYWRTAGYAAEELDAAIALERDLVLDGYRTDGFDALQRVVSERLAQPERHYYVLQDALGRRIGNLPPFTPVAGWIDIVLKERAGNAAPRRARGFGVVLPGGGYLLVGRDLAQVDALRAMITQAFLWAIGATVLLALVGGALVSMRFLSRVDAVGRATREIMDGNLARRLPVSGADDEFDRLAAELNRMLERMQQLMENLRQVSNDIAHDLRTPLTRLRQHLESARVNARSVEDYRAAVDHAIQDSEAVLSTFGALLRIAQVEAGSRRASFSAVDLSALFEAMVETYAAVAEDAGQELVGRIAPDVQTHGDKDLLTQMLANLVENAVRHSARGARIAVTLDGQVGVVADSGPGVPEAERDKVLRRFYRLEASRTTPGSGLGLALVAAIAELHGIALELGDNRPGLRVTLRFPPPG
jgi:signal transduction histidine kinase